MNQIAIPGIPFSFDGIVVFGWISIFLIIGMVLRANIPFLRRYLVPASIIGGVTGLLCQGSGLLTVTGFGLNGDLVQLIVYHLFNLTWIFLGLKIPPPEPVGAAKGKSISAMRTSIWIVLALVGIMGLVNLTGLLSTTVLQAAGMNDGPATLGVLMSAGFLGGPGQALTMAKVWEASSTFQGMSDFALAGASTGFAVAVIVGIPLINIAARRRKVTCLSAPTMAEQTGFYNECDETSTAGCITTSVTNIDVLAYHCALGLGTYLLTLIAMGLLCLIVPSGIVPLIWGVFFLVCCIMGLIMRKILVWLHKGHLCCEGVNSRITNSLIDFLVCGTFMGIQLGSVASIGKHIFLPPFA